jgi:hypothetical protein
MGRGRPSPTVRGAPAGSRLATPRAQQAKHLSAVFALVDDQRAQPPTHRGDASAMPLASPGIGLPVRRSKPDQPLLPRAGAGGVVLSLSAELE